MARYRFINLKASSVSRKRTFCFRYRIQDDMLSRSIKRFGILMPIIVTGDKQPVVVSGHKRFYAALKLKLREVPVLQTEKIAPQNAFLINLVSNWRQGFSEMDRARALTMAIRNFCFSEEELREVVMPLLGLSGDKNTLKAYLGIDALTPAMKDFFENEGMPLRCIVSFLKFSAKDQDSFAGKIAQKVKLTSSQLLQTGEWLSDLMKDSGKSLESLLKNGRILKILGHPKMDLRTKADKFFEEIKRLRFPGYSAYLEEFAARKSDFMKDFSNVSLEPITGFEEKGFELHARVKGSKDLDKIHKMLLEKRPSLNSLFDVML